MTILEKSERIAFRKLFDQDPAGIFEVFMKKLQTEISKRSVVAETEWETAKNAIMRETQVTAIDQVLDQMDEELNPKLEGKEDE